MGGCGRGEDRACACHAAIACAQPPRLLSDKLAAGVLARMFARAQRCVWWSEHESFDEGHGRVRQLTQGILLSWTKRTVLVAVVMVNGHSSTSVTQTRKPPQRHSALWFQLMPWQTTQALALDNAPCSCPSKRGMVQLTLSPLAAFGEPFVAPPLAPRRPALRLPAPAAAPTTSATIPAHAPST